ncbi:MAG: S8 family peptidase [Ginsengibacter sp.]
MPQLKVIAPKLNKRTSPVLDFADKRNVVGILQKDELFDAITKITNALGTWYGNKEGHWASEKWLISSETTPWWLQSLEIPKIWRIYNERGARAKVAVLDSGYVKSNLEIREGVALEFVHSEFPSSVTIEDTFGHGNYCASLIGARNINHIVGCAPECKLYIAKISEEDTFELNILFDAIDWAIRQGVDIISISQGGPFDKNTCDLITRAFEKNIIVVASIGNNLHSDQIIRGGKFPALCTDCLAVGATNTLGGLSPVTLLNEKTEINAPGEEILGYIKESTPELFPNGTSQAAAITAGICALIISRHKFLGKTYSAKSIKELITSEFDVVKEMPNQKLIAPVKIFENI